MRLILASLLCILMSAAFCGEDSGWREVEAPAYRAKINETGELSVDLDNGDKVKLSLIQCWRFYQISRDVKSVQFETDSTSRTVRINYLWNDGTVTQVVKFTSQSIAVDYEYESHNEKPIKAEWFCCLLHFSLKGKGKPPISGWRWRMGTEFGLLDIPDWVAPKRERFSCLTLDAVGGYRMDVIAENDNWLGLKKKRPDIFVWSKRRWGGPKLEPGEILRLGTTLWFSKLDGTNIETEKLILK